MPFSFPRCQVLPLPDHQVSFQVEGLERLRWHCGPSYPRPFFYPLPGPSGHPLTRMGHPGAPNHDHHRSIWFAHARVMGNDFWSDQSPARIRQKTWLHYQDGDEEAVLAVLLGWHDGHGARELLEQELVAAVRPAPEKEILVELQATFRPTAETLEFGKTNFGFLAVRVAKNLSAYFGGGQITSSAGARGETAIFAKPARWMDYSGPVPGGGSEGVTYFDHPGNPGYPAHWHVREDGWMGASVCLTDPVITTRRQPLLLRYLLYAHRGEAPLDRIERIGREFATRPRFVVTRAVVKHQEYLIQRGPANR